MNLYYINITVCEIIPRPGPTIIPKPISLSYCEIIPRPTETWPMMIPRYMIWSFRDLTYDYPYTSYEHPDTYEYSEIYWYLWLSRELYLWSFRDFLWSSLDLWLSLDHSDTSNYLVTCQDLWFYPETETLWLSLDLPRSDLWLSLDPWSLRA